MGQRTDFKKKLNNKLIYFDATVGTGGDYPAINGLKTAIEDGKQNINVISDISVTQDITILSKDISITSVEGYTLTFADDVTTSGNGAKLLKFENVNISYNNLTVDALFYNVIFVFNLGEIIMNNSANGNYLIYGPKTGSTITNSKIYLANSTSAITREDMSIGTDNCTFIGGGSSCALAVTNARVLRNNITLEGTFWNTYIWGGGVIYSAQINNLRSTVVFPIANLIGTRINCPNAFIYANGANDIRTFSLKSVRKCANASYFYNGTFSDALSCSFSESVDTVFENVKFNGGDLTVYNCDNITFRNCTFSADVILSSATNCIFDNCTLDGGTIILDALSENTKIENCDTLTEIVLAGINTTLLNNDDSDNVLVKDLEVTGSIKLSGIIQLTGLNSVEIATLMPTAGDVVFNTTTNKHQGYDGSVWKDFY